MELKNKQESNANQKQDNGIFGIIALFLILIIGFSIQSLLALLSESYRIIETLWEPSESALFFTGPTFVLICLITVWILAPKASQMKFIFKRVSIIGIIFYLIYVVFVGYIFALGSGMRN